jgi:CBS domain-containing protein
MRVFELMTQDVHTCRPDEALDQAARIMWDYDVGVVPVIDEERRVVGIVTDRDLCMAAYTQGKALTEIPIEQVMSKRIIVAAAEDLVVRAERMMQDAQVRRLPVVDDQGRLIGILSQNDLLREAVREAHFSPREMTSAEVAEVLADIGRPRGARTRLSH